MKHFLLDCNNIIHTHKDWKVLFLQSAAGAMNALLNLIEIYNSKYPSYKFQLVFDSPQELLPKLSTISVHWPKNGKDADSVIKTIVEKTIKTSVVSVVSSDSEIQSFSRRFDCSVLSSKEFLALIDKSPVKNKQVSSASNSKQQSPSEKPNRITKKEFSEFKQLFSTNEKL